MNFKSVRQPKDAPREFFNPPIEKDLRPPLIPLVRGVKAMRPTRGQNSPGVGNFLSPSSELTSVPVPEKAFPRIYGDSLHRFQAILRTPLHEGEAAERKNLWERFDADGELEAWYLSDRR